MKKIFSIYFKADDTRPFIVLFSLLVASLCEAVGISMLVPAIAILSDQTGSSNLSSSFGKWLTAGMEQFGVQPTLGVLLLIIALAFTLKSLISFVSLTYAGIVASRVAVRLRQRLINGLLNANWSFYSDQKSGNLANAVSNDATRAGEAYLLAAQFLANLVQSVVYAVVALLIDWRLALMGFAVSALMAQILSVLIRMSRRAGRRQRDRINDLTVEVVDMLANIKPLKSMNRYAPLYNSFQRSIDKLQKNLNIREISRQALNQAGDAFLVISVTGIIYVVHTVWQTPISELVVSGILFLKVVSNAMRLQRSLQQAVQVENSYERLTELVVLTESHKEELLGKSEPDLKANIHFEDVSIAFGDKLILNAVNLVIPARNITVLKGPSGSGKTTIVDLLIGLHRPTSGRIMLGTTPLSEIDLLTFRSRIGYVPQELNLLHSTVRHNITMGDQSIPDDAVMEALELAGAAEFIAGLPAGLDTNVGEMGGKLSGGQRQRISLARALVRRPAMLILDEVTSALDPATEAEIIRNIAELSPRYTIIVITHHESWASIADQLYNIRNGEAVKGRISASD